MDVWQCTYTWNPSLNRFDGGLCQWNEIADASQGFVVDVLTNGWFIAGAYIVIGLLLGRVALTVANRRAGMLDTEDGVGIAFAALFWPLAVFGAAGWWFMSGGVRRDVKRAEKRRARVRQLREEADVWDRKRYDGTEAERAMAAQLATLCREQAEELRNA